MRGLLFLLLVSIVHADIAHGQDAQKPNILVLIADDWSFPHAGIYGDRVVKTPAIDAVGGEGVVFMNAFTASPSCTPSRAAILTGRFPHELEEGASLWGALPKKFDNYTRILEGAEYHVGQSGKGWGPGNFTAGGYEHNPAGKKYRNFESFLKDKPEGKPFVFWFGSSNPHRPYTAGSGAASQMNAAAVNVPAWLPDVPEVRDDLLDYYHEVELFDQQVDEAISLLKENGAYSNTLIIITSDNGMPFPRAKANLYDAGTKVPLIITMAGRIKPGKVDQFVSLTDLAPTILELSGEDIPGEVSGSSLLPLLNGGKAPDRQVVFIERERHANVRKSELGYPARAIRTEHFLYIRNYGPDRWPAGDPELYHSVGSYGDIDDSPSKQYVMRNRDNSAVSPFFARGFEKRPAEELYDLRNDPHQLVNVASKKKYRTELERLKKQLKEWQVDTGDPRVAGQEIKFDQYPYFGPPASGAPSDYKPR